MRLVWRIGRLMRVSSSLMRRVGKLVLRVFSSLMRRIR